MYLCTILCVISLITITVCLSVSVVGSNCLFTMIVKIETGVVVSLHTALIDVVERSWASSIVLFCDLSTFLFVKLSVNLWLVYFCYI
jgi:hypothetical protein